MKFRLKKGAMDVMFKKNAFYVFLDMLAFLLTDSHRQSKFLNKQIPIESPHDTFLIDSTLIQFQLSPGSALELVIAISK